MLANSLTTQSANSLMTQSANSMPRRCLSRIIQTVDRERAPTSYSSSQGQAPTGGEGMLSEMLWRF